MRTGGFLGRRISEIPWNCCLIYNFMENNGFLNLIDAMHPKKPEEATEFSNFCFRGTKFHDTNPFSSCQPSHIHKKVRCHYHFDLSACEDACTVPIHTVSQNCRGNS